MSLFALAALGSAFLSLALLKLKLLGVANDHMLAPRIHQTISYTVGAPFLSLNLAYGFWPFWNLTKLSDSPFWLNESDCTCNPGLCLSASGSLGVGILVKHPLQNT